MVKGMKRPKRGQVEERGSPKFGFDISQVVVCLSVKTETEIKTRFLIVRISEWRACDVIYI